ncbi:chaplin [Streptomyces sp. NPDC007084]|uniref:chaplin n=1 Tax=Streptomyces sp. NPDC007084 TaxID=3154313 RepID=UPI0034523115
MRIRLMAATGLAAAALFATAGTAAADPGPDAVGVAANSPGVLSGNVVQIPVDLGLNLCGNTVDVVGLLNPAFGNICANG